MSQYCVKKTPEEAQKEMEEMTKKELLALNKHIKNNPEIIIKKKIILDDNESYISSDNETDNCKEIYDLQKELDDVDNKYRYSLLEINNLTIQVNELSETVSNLINENAELYKFQTTVEKILQLDYDLDNFINKVTQIKEDNILTKRIQDMPNKDKVGVIMEIVIPLETLAIELRNRYNELGSLFKSPNKSEIALKNILDTKFKKFNEYNVDSIKNMYYIDGDLLMLFFFILIVIMLAAFIIKNI